MVNLKGKPVVSFCVHGLCVDCRVIRQLLLQSEGDWHQKIWFGSGLFCVQRLSRVQFHLSVSLISVKYHGVVDFFIANVNSYADADAVMSDSNDDSF